MKKILAVCGATASGKTALAVECAKRLDGEIISCDALLVYRGLDIGTAKPDEGERQGIPHYMSDVADPYDNFSVSDFERLAKPVLDDILSRGKTPVLCGGTGFYMNALLFPHSYGDTPASAEIRQKYIRLEQEKGREYLHGLLQSVAFDYPREELYRRIGIRTQEMIGRGLVDEVRGLLASGVPKNAQCMQGIGYKEVVAYLENGGPQSTMSDIIEKNTRNYAKRQLTFFKKMPYLYFITPQNTEQAAQEVLKIYES